MSADDHCIGCTNPNRDQVRRADCSSCRELTARAERARIRYARETSDADRSRRESGRDPRNGWRP